jgi:hypothetical protein
MGREIFFWYVGFLLLVQFHKWSKFIQASNTDAYKILATENVYKQRTLIIFFQNRLSLILNKSTVESKCFITTGEIQHHMKAA